MSGKMNRVAYRPIGLALGMAAGAFAGMVFKQVWKLAVGDEEAPSAIDEERRWGGDPRRGRVAGGDLRGGAGRGGPWRGDRDTSADRTVARLTAIRNMVLFRD